MPALSPSIQAVLSLHSSCSGALSEENLAAIQHVQNMIQNGTHADGWLKVKGPSVVGRSFRPAASSNSWNARGGGGGGGGSLPSGRGAGGGNSRYASGSSNDANIARNFRSGAPAMSGGGGGWTSVSTTKPRSGGGVPSSAKGPVPKYVSVFKNEGENKEGIILNSIIQGKLNKFSDDTYSDVKSFLQQILDGDQQDFLKAFMVLVFQMAADQECYCALYARLLGELSTDHPVLLREMNELHSKYLSVFENVQVQEDPSVDYDAFVRQNKEKKYRLGYSQFLAELVRLNILADEILNGTLQKIINEMTRLHVLENKTPMLEEYSDCMARMMRAFNGNESHIVSRRRALKETFGEKIRVFTTITPEAVSMRPKIKFAMMNIMDILNK
jgi:hypothetical protein